MKETLKVGRHPPRATFWHFFASRWSRRWKSLGLLGPPSHALRFPLSIHAFFHENVPSVKSVNTTTPNPSPIRRQAFQM